jgi:biotin/methionine sulfoxide reductase
MSWSLQRAHHGEQPYWAAVALAAISGQIGLPGGGVGFGYASLGGIGGPLGIGKNPAISAGRQAIDSYIPVARIADMLLSPGATYTYSGQTRRYPDARLVYWAGGNPYHHHQDLNRLQEAWSRPETIIVQDPYFTATARRADIVLPATTSIERNDIGANSRSDLMIAMQQAIRPLGQSRSDYDIFSELASRLDVGDLFSEGRSEMDWLRHLYEDARAANAIRHNFEMPDFDTFWNQGWALSPTQSNYTYLAEFRADPHAHGLDTESGRIVLGSETLSRLAYDDCKSHPAWLEPAEWLGSASAAGRFHLISNQPEGRLHSQIETGEASLGQKRNGREQLSMNPADAKRLMIEDGETVRLWNERGECLATAALRATVREGVVVLPTGAWFTPTGNSGLDISGNPNVLTADIPTSSFGQGCSAHTCLVSVERFAGDVEDAMARYDAELAGAVQ